MLICQATSLVVLNALGYLGFKVYGHPLLLNIFVLGIFLIFCSQHFPHVLNNSGQIFCDQTISLSKPSLSHFTNTGGDHVRGSKGFNLTIFKRCLKEEYSIIILSFFYRVVFFTVPP